MAGGTSIFNNPPPKRKAKLPTLCTLAAKTEIQIGDCTLLHSPPAPAPGAHPRASPRHEWRDKGKDERDDTQITEKRDSMDSRALPLLYAVL